MAAYWNGTAVNQNIINTYNEINKFNFMANINCYD